MFQETYTITFGDVAENHVNMEKLGSMSESGFDIDDLNTFKNYFEKKGLSTIIYDFRDLVQEKEKTNKKGKKEEESDDEDEEEVSDEDDEDDEESSKEDNELKDKKRKTLNNKSKDNRKIKKSKKEESDCEEGEDKKKKNKIEYNEAYLLIIRNGLSAICDPNDFHKEQKKLEKDKKAFMYGRVVNKTARHNLCFTDGVSRDPDYEKGMGRVVSFNDCPLLLKTKNTFKDILGEKANDLVAEGNYYYDINKCGIGWHGDAERRKVIAIRTGHRMKICFNWFLDSKSIGTKFEEYLNHGDIYMMSEFSVGYNWKKKKIPTLRHSAGSSKYTNL